MKFIHTSDWHLGKKLFGASLIGVQKDILAELIAVLRREKVQLLIVAGDIFDKAIPTAEALGLFESFLYDVSRIEGLHTLIIPGNHDSATRLGFLNSFLKHNRIHIQSSPQESHLPVTFSFEDGPVQVYAFPYAHESVYTQCLRDLGEKGEGFSAWVSHVGKQLDNRARNIAVAHTFLQGAMESESERPLFIGGEKGLSSKIFEAFSYTALGHIHKGQKIGKDNIRYSGAIYKYSFSEVDYAKAFHLFTMDEKGKLKLQKMPYVLPKDLKILKGTFEELLAGVLPEGERNHYIKVILTDKRPILDPMLRLKEVYPNILQIERAYLTPFADEQKRFSKMPKEDSFSLLSCFYEDIYEKALDGEEASFLKEFLNKGNLSL